MISLYQALASLSKGEADRDTHKTLPCEDKAETRVLRIRSKNTKDYRQTTEAGEMHGIASPSQPSEGTSTAHILISDYQPPALGENTPLLSV